MLVHFFPSEIEGGYLLLETSGIQENQLARWNSPIIINPGEWKCLEFWFYRHGSSLGNLEVHSKVVDASAFDWLLMWRLSGDQGANWVSAKVPLSKLTKLYKLKFEGQVGSFGGKSDMAIDDITFTNDPMCSGELRETSLLGK